MIRRTFIVGAAALAVVIAGACTDTAIVALRIDLLAYFSADTTTIDVSVPPSIPLRVYLLPGVYVDPAGTGPDGTAREGAQVSIPQPAESSGLDVVAAIRAAVRVANRSSTEPVPPLSVRAYVADATATDVYAAGDALPAATLPSVAPGASDTLAMEAVVSSGDTAYDALLSGEFRLGVLLEVDQTGSASVPVTLDLESLEIEARVRPFKALE